MTKAQEVALLERTIAAFGRESYLGPWLAEYRTTIEADIWNDVCPSAVLPRAARLEAAAILEAARTEAATIRTAAFEQARIAREAARENCATIRGDCRRTVERLLAYL